MKKVMMGTLFAVFCAAAGPAALVDTYSFERITSNCTDDVSGQLSVEIYDDGLVGGYQQVTFKFINSGPVQSSISEIYFYDGSLFQLALVDDSSAGVDYENAGQPVAPPKLPGYDPDPLEIFGASEGVNPEPVNGVNPGEWVSIIYTLQAGKTYQDILYDLDNGQVVIGLHVKSINCAPTDPQAGSVTYSDSFITVPEPATWVILGLGGLLLRRRRRNKP